MHPKLELSQEVLRNKIANKEAKLKGHYPPPESPEGYAHYRSMVRPHPEGSNVMQLLLDAKRQVETMPVLEGNRDAGIWNWEWLGPGNIGGRTRAVLTHPEEPNTLWLGGASGGIWKSLDAGASWFPINDFLPSLVITSLVMDPLDHDTLYAGTGSGFFSSFALPGAGIFKSTNGGDSWQQLPMTVSPDAYYITDVACHPTEEGWLIACGGTVDHEGRIWRSENGGLSWDVSNLNGMPLDVKYDTEHPDVVIIGGNNWAHRSDTAGEDWDVISTGDPGGLPQYTGRCEIAFGQGSDVVYASLNMHVAPGAAQGEIWRSLDNGITWEKRSEEYHLGVQGWFCNVIWVEPGSTERIITGGVELFSSSDGGTNLTAMNDWQQYHTGLSSHADNHAIVPHINYDGTDERRIYVGNDGGVQVAAFGFQTQPLQGWVNLAHGLGITQFFHADAAPDGSVILGATLDNDDLRWRPGEGTGNWYQAKTGDGTFCAINPGDTDIMYACYPHLKMERSVDGGDTYSNIFDDILDAENDGDSLFMSPFALDKLGPHILFAGGKHIWRSSDHGSHWSESLGALTGDPNCSAIEICPSHASRVVWVGYENGMIYKTENYGLNWSAVESSVGPLPNHIITDIEISPYDPATVLVTFGGYFDQQIWITEDSGATWESRSGSGPGSLPDIQVNCISYHATSPNWIYAGTDLGLFASEDLGQTWNQTPRYANHESPVNTEIADLIWHSGDIMVAVTHGRGMYQCRPLQTIWVDGAYVGIEDGSQLHPYNTVAEAEANAGHGTNIFIKGGLYDEGAQVLRKRGEIIGQDGTVEIR